MSVMKAKTKKAKAEVPFDPVLFAATVPARKPTPRDLADAKEHKDDAVEPQQYDSMKDMVKDLFDDDVIVSFSIGPHGIVSK